MDTVTDTATTAKRGRPFQPGTDPRRAPGKPKGAKARPERLPQNARALARQMIEQHAQGITEKIISGALAGDADCLKIAVARLLPPAVPGEPVVGMEMLKHSDPAIASQAIVDAVAEGRLAPERADLLMRLLAQRAELGLATVIGQRVEQLNALLARGGMPQLTAPGITRLTV